MAIPRRYYAQWLFVGACIVCAISMASRRQQGASFTPLRGGDVDGIDNVDPEAAFSSRQLKRAKTNDGGSCTACINAGDSGRRANPSPEELWRRYDSHFQHADAPSSTLARCCWWCMDSAYCTYRQPEGEGRGEQADEPLEHRVRGGSEHIHSGGGQASGGRERSRRRSDGWGRSWRRRAGRSGAPST